MKKTLERISIIAQEKKIIILLLILVIGIINTKLLQDHLKQQQDLNNYLRSPNRHLLEYATVDDFLIAKCEAIGSHKDICKQSLEEYKQRNSNR